MNDFKNNFSSLIRYRFFPRRPAKSENRVAPRHFDPDEGGKALLLVFALQLVLGAAGCVSETPAPVQQENVLIRIGERAITREDFDVALANAQSAYSLSTLQDPLVVGHLKIGALNQLIEEMIIAGVAEANGIGIPEAELAAAAADIQKDYPEGVFEQLLLERAVSYSAWKARLRSRLLAEKVVERVLGDKISMDAEALSAYYRSRPQPDQTQDPQKVLALLKREKIEKAYGIWIDSLKKDTPMEVNPEEWARTFGGPVSVGQSGPPDMAGGETVPSDARAMDDRARTP